MSSLYPDLDLTSFPGSNDQRYIMIDPSTAADMAAINTYNTYLAAGDMNAALAVLDSNPRLQKMLFNAEKWNRHEDMLIALERFYESDVQQYLVNIVVYRGSWNAVAAYGKYNVVYAENNQAYMAVQAVPAGTLVSDVEYWIPITLRGAQGESGTGLSWRGQWDAAVAYTQDDCVAYNETLYGALQPSTGKNPATATEYWTPAFKIDLTADAILTRLKTVDGDGSGLDADTLDGVHAGAFARKSIERHVTALSTGWTGDGPYEQVISVQDMMEDCNAVVGLARTATAEEAKVCRAARLRPIGQGVDSMTIAADGPAPGVDLPLTVIILG